MAFALALVANLMAATAAAQTSLRLEDAFGVRLGMVANSFWNSTQPTQNTFDAPPLTSGVRPALNPFYEAPLSRGLTASAELMLVYRSFAVLGLSDTRFESYGFNASCRWEPSVSAGGWYSQTHYYVRAGLGFDTFTDRVSVSLPISIGELFPLSNTSQFELAVLATPELFLGLGPGMYYGITAGIRFLNPR